MSHLSSRLQPGQPPDGGYRVSTRQLQNTVSPPSFFSSVDIDVIFVAVDLHMCFPQFMYSNCTARMLIAECAPRFDSAYQHLHLHFITSAISPIILSRSISSSPLPLTVGPNTDAQTLTHQTPHTSDPRSTHIKTPTPSCPSSPLDSVMHPSFRLPSQTDDDYLLPPTIFKTIPIPLKHLLPWKRLAIFQTASKTFQSIKSGPCHKTLISF